LELGKNWFYEELRKTAPVETNSGWETKEMRDAAGLKKSGNKMAPVFESHCVDSWVMANSWTGGHIKPDNMRLMCLVPLRFHRRQLHVLHPAKGGFRKFYGGTRSLGFKRGSLVKHPKWKMVYVGGTREKRINLYSLCDGKMLTRAAKPFDCNFLTYNSWRWSFPSLPMTNKLSFVGERSITRKERASLSIL
jgi:hypothetical protein